MLERILVYNGNFHIFIWRIYTCEVIWSRIVLFHTNKRDSSDLRDEQIFEYIRIFEYFPSNIKYSNTNIKILPHEYIRIFEIFPPNIYEYFGNKNLIYWQFLYAFKTTTHIFLNFLLKQFLQMIQLNQDLIRSSKTGCGLDICVLKRHIVYWCSF